MADFLTLSYKDESSERSTVSIRMRDDFADDITRAAEYTDMQDAVNGLSLGNLQYTEERQRTTLSNAAATDANANREQKILVTYFDNVTFKTFSKEIPIADRSAVTKVSANSDEIVLADGGAMAAFVSAFEATARTDAGNAVTVTKATWVGRNL